MSKKLYGIAARVHNYKSKVHESVHNDRPTLSLPPVTCQRRMYAQIPWMSCLRCPRRHSNFTLLQQTSVSHCNLLRSPYYVQIVIAAQLLYNKSRNKKNNSNEIERISSFGRIENRSNLLLVPPRNWGRIDGAFDGENGRKLIKRMICTMTRALHLGHSLENLRAGRE